jgi:hypothetical protein
MTLAKELVGAGFTPQRIVTTVTVTMEQLSAGWTITSVRIANFFLTPNKDRHPIRVSPGGQENQCLWSKVSGRHPIGRLARFAVNKEQVFLSTKGTGVE